MLCPVCSGTASERLPDGNLRCTSQVVVGGVPPGMGGNATLQHVPIYGVCGAVASEAAWRAKAAEVRREGKKARMEAELRQQAERDLERCRIELLAKLAQLGYPGTRERNVPGRYHLSRSAKLFGRVGDVLPVSVEAAWPIGAFTWMKVGAHGTEHFEELPTGYTPTERIVPLDHGIEGDDAVERLFRRWSLPLIGPNGRPIRKPSKEDIVAGLENALASTP
jgi:hypothetical protein